MTNSNSENRHEKKRNDTKYKIEEAINFLRAKNLSVTRTSIAEETGIHYNTLKQPYIRDFLHQYSEFKSDIEETTVLSLAEAITQINDLQEKLQRIKQTNRNLISENTIIKSKYRELNEKYQHLLGRYQLDTGRKIIPF